jgi:uncharacterized membrane protein
MSDDYQAQQPPAPPAPPVMPPASGGGDVPSNTGKLLATLSYLYFIWPIPGIIALLIDPYKDEHFVRLHAIQSLALGLAVWIATGVLFFLPGVPWLIGVVYGIILALKANKGESFEVPVIYNIVKRYI